MQHGPCQPKDTPLCQHIREAVEEQILARRDAHRCDQDVVSLAQGEQGEKKPCEILHFEIANCELRVWMFMTLLTLRMLSVSLSSVCFG